MNQMNPLKLLRLKGAWEQFKLRHPKLPAFFGAVAAGGFQEGSVLELVVTTPQGKKYSANMKVTAEDMQLLEEIKELGSDIQ